MARPEWDLALICEELCLLPANIGNLLQNQDGEKLRDARTLGWHLGKEHWPSILAAVEAFGAVSEIPDPNNPPEKRRWRVSEDLLKSLVRNVELIIDILPDARRRFCSDQDYRIAATIPERLHVLQGFLGKFENTVLGLRRLISEASKDLVVLVPFMDADGLSEIFPSLERALDRGIVVTFLTRELGEGGRNMTVLSRLVDVAKRDGHSLELREAVMPDSTPISHAKVFSRDGSDEVYVGSANLTSTSMEKTIEIGVFLKGEEARPISGFLSLVQELSVQRWP